MPAFSPWRVAILLGSIIFGELTAKHNASRNNSNLEIC
jgi:hypothetical protein